VGWPPGMTARTAPRLRIRFSGRSPSQKLWPPTQPNRPPSPDATYWHYTWLEDSGLLFHPSGGIRMPRVDQRNLQPFNIVPKADAGLRQRPGILSALGLPEISPATIHCCWSSGSPKTELCGRVPQERGTSPALACTGQQKRRRVPVSGSPHSSEPRFQIQSNSMSESDACVQRSPASYLRMVSP